MLTKEFQEQLLSAIKNDPFLGRVKLRTTLGDSIVLPTVNNDEYGKLELELRDKSIKVKTRTVIEQAVREINKYVVQKIVAFEQIASEFTALSSSTGRTITVEKLSIDDMPRLINAMLRPYRNDSVFVASKSALQMLGIEGVQKMYGYEVLEHKWMNFGYIENAFPVMFVNLGKAFVLGLNLNECHLTDTDITLRIGGDVLTPLACSLLRVKNTE